MKNNHYTPRLARAGGFLLERLLVWQAGSGQRPLNDVCLAASDVAKKFAMMVVKKADII